MTQERQPRSHVRRSAIEEKNERRVKCDIADDSQTRVESDRRIEILYNICKTECILKPSHNKLLWGGELMDEFGVKKGTDFLHATVSASSDIKSLGWIELIGKNRR
jgi:hypothetical protein